MYSPKSIRMVKVGIRSFLWRGDIPASDRDYVMLFIAVLLVLEGDSTIVLYNDCRINCYLIVFKGRKLIVV